MTCNSNKFVKEIVFGQELKTNWYVRLNQIYSSTAPSLLP